MADSTASTSVGAGGGQVVQELAPSIDLELEVAGLPADPRGELGRDAPAEVLESIGGGLPRGEDRRAQALDVAVLVAGGRSDVVGGDDPTAAVVEAAQDEDDAEPRQLVVGQAHRGTTERVEDVLERVGLDRRGQAVADRRGPDRDPRVVAPRVRGQVVGQLGDRQGRRVGADGRVETVVRRSGGHPRAPSRVHRPGAASRMSRPCRAARWSASRLERTAAGPRRASTCRRPTQRPRQAPGPAPRRAPTASRPAPRRACRCGSAPRWSAASEGRAGRPTGPARARCRPTETPGERAGVPARAASVRPGPGTVKRPGIHRARDSTGAER